MDKNILIDKLLDMFLAEGCSDRTILTFYPDKRKAIRALMNMRPAMPASSELLRLQDELLQIERDEKRLIDPYDLLTVRESFHLSKVSFAERLVLWQGDITRLKAGAIVNAANAAMLGCWQPLHNCIDNVIHSAAGIQLRLACNEIIQRQGHEEPTGHAQITPGFNLPTSYVLHTVGPIIGGKVSTEQEQLLSSCYTSCLELAATIPEIRTVAFCCISTGVFGYPKEEAAPVAIRSVGEWMAKNPDRMDRVVFNVFTDEDLRIYSELLCIST